MQPIHTINRLSKFKLDSSELDSSKFDLFCTNVFDAYSLEDTTIRIYCAQRDSLETSIIIEKILSFVFRIK